MSQGGGGLPYIKNGGFVMKNRFWVFSLRRCTVRAFVLLFTVLIWKKHYRRCVVAEPVNLRGKKEISSHAHNNRILVSIKGSFQNVLFKYIYMRFQPLPSPIDK